MNFISFAFTVLFSAYSVSAGCSVADPKWNPGHNIASCIPGTKMASLYAVGLGSCGWTNTANEMVAAIYDGKAHCGETVTIQNKNHPERKVTVKIVHTCPSCQGIAGPGNGATIDLSQAAFEELFLADTGVFDVVYTTKNDFPY